MPATLQLTRVFAGPGRAALRGWAALVVASAVCPALAAAQSFSPYSDFQAMTPAQLVTLQAKLTWLGPQLKPVRTVLFTSTLGTLNAGLFVPFRRPAFDYINDDGGLLDFRATTAELEAMIDSVGTLPVVTAGGVDSNGMLSFAMLNTAGGTKAFEAIVDSSNGSQLLARMRGALAGNPAAVRRLDELACALDLAPTAVPAEVSGDVSVTLTGVRLERKTGKFVGRVRVTNNSGSSLPPPLTLVLDLQPNVSLVGETGHTCRIYPVGRPYVDLAVGAGLAPGAFVEQLLRFENPDLDRIQLQSRVFAGAGAR